MEEIGAKLTLKDRRKFSTDAAAAKRDIEGLGTAAEKAGRKAGMASAPSGGFGVLRSGLGVLSGLAKTGIVALAGAGVAAVGFGVKTRASMEQAEIGFTTMLGSAGAAKSFMVDLRKFARETPFQLPDVVTGAQRLLAMGFAARDILPTLTSLGDAAAGLGLGAEGLDRITTAIGQIKAKGALQAEEMRQLAEAGIPAWDFLAKKLGTDIPHAMKLVEARSVTSSVAIAAITEGMNAKFGGLMEKQSHTIAGIWSNIKDTISQGLGDAVIPFQDDLKHAENWFLDFAGRIFKALPSISARLRQQLPRAWDALQSGDANGVAAAIDKVFGAGGSLVPTLTKVVQLGMDFWTLLRDGIIPAFLGLSKAIPLGTLNLAADVMGLLADHASVAGPMIVGLAFGYYTLRTAMLLTNGAIKAITIAQWAWNAAALANPYVLLAVAIALLAVDLYLAYKRFDAFRRLVDNTARWIKDHWKEAIVVGLGGPVAWVADLIYHNWDSIVSFVYGLPGRITSAATGMFDGIYNAFADTVNGILDWWDQLDFTLDFPTQSTPFGDIGGWSFTIGTPDIPFRIPNLAAGGIVSPTPGGVLARLAEAGHPEMVTPLPLSGEVTPMATAVRDTFAGARHQDHRPIEVRVMLDRRQIALASVDGIRDEAARR